MWCQLMEDGMKRIIDGITYNTDTATFLCGIECSTEYQNDLDWHDTSLYLTRTGRFFLQGEGNACSMWARAIGSGSKTGGEGILPCTPEEAREHLERADEWEEIERLFPKDRDDRGDEIDDEVRSTLRLPRSLQQRVSDAAAAKCQSVNAYVMRALEAALATEGKK
jgi:hypothetical protein